MATSLHGGKKNAGKRSALVAFVLGLREWVGVLQREGVASPHRWVMALSGLSPLL